MKLVPSAKADSASLTSDVPALPCRAFMCRRCAAEAGYVPPRALDIELLFR